MNVFLDQVHRNLPRLLALFNNDTSSATYGVGDRYYWGWKLIDFPNGTFQAAVGGLSSLIKHNMLPDYINEERLIERIDSLFSGTRFILNKNGSLDEALPNEYSFCVTGLVAGELILAAENLKDRVDPTVLQRWVSIISPMIDFLEKQDEHHGVISNHLATNALALVRWSDFTGENRDVRAKIWVNRILQHQSEEGWFSEYGGADFGYQTWCTSSLVEIFIRRKKWQLGDPIDKSITFLAHGAIPGGLWGGVYGSRMTRFVFPSGVYRLSNKSVVANKLSKFFYKSILDQQSVTLDVIDMGNFVPMFNDYVTCAVEFNRISTIKEVCTLKQEYLLPCERIEYRRVFSESGLLIDSGEDHYTLINLKKGGVGIHSSSSSGLFEIPAFVGKTKNGSIISNQLLDDNATWYIDDGKVTLKSETFYVDRPLPSAFKFIVLRGMSLTIFRSLKLGNMVKILLANLLISRKRRAKIKVERQVILGGDIQVYESVENATRLHVNNFKQIHMASMGYWQKSDESIYTLPIIVKN
ncbi:hypothetical protein [Vibrio sp. HN007]|uniref:hypothetical protein n=1 Tax=Vibrio iocasae TaxID=3098914 RepID=UPI0035D3F09A